MAVLILPFQFKILVYSFKGTKFLCAGCETGAASKNVGSDNLNSLFVCLQLFPHQFWMSGHRPTKQTLTTA